MLEGCNGVYIKPQRENAGKQVKLLERKNYNETNN
jgi:hypothetical protein